jgi:hypothetical protein
VGGKVHNREEWKKLLRTARNHHVLQMPIDSDQIVGIPFAVGKEVIKSLLRKEHLCGRPVRFATNPRC